MLTTLFSDFDRTPVETDNFQVLARNRAIHVQEHLSTLAIRDYSCCNVAIEIDCV